ncbi:MAG TPA: Rieske 2Fe-2S domain-containing protein [Candidatus Nitrosocosmicus sp.]
MSSQEDFVKVADINEIKSSQMKEVEVEGQKILIANIKEKYYAIGNICTHEGGPLANGTLHDFEVECPWHGSKFDVRTGEVTNPPASEPELSYEIKVEGNQILVKKQGKRKDPQIELTLLEKIKVDGTDVMSFKFKKENTGGKEDTLDNISNTPQLSFDYRAGQFAFFDIGGVYNDSKGPVRHFTISSSPTENFIMLSTRIRDSPYKKRLESLEEGTKVKVRGPEGKFVLDEEDNSKTIVFLSGGIGVTPFRSMIKYVTDKQLPIKIIMFDSNKNKESILFKQEFDEWSNINKNIKIIYTVTEEENPSKVQSSTSMNIWKGEYGRINKEMILRHVDASGFKDSLFYICGPLPMIKAMKSLIQEELKIPKERIMVEEFTGY